MPWEAVPPDYTILKMDLVPVCGGDTLFASGYEIYNRLSPPWKAFTETLNVTFAEPSIGEVAKTEGLELYTGPRGSPDNIGLSLQAIHPVHSSLIFLSVVDTHEPRYKEEIAVRRRQLPGKAHSRCHKARVRTNVAIFQRFANQ